MIMRAIWVLALGVIACLAAVAQVDRQSRYSPQYARLVPEFMGGFALRSRIKDAFIADDPQRALALAQSLVRNRPMPAENLRLLGHAQLLGDPNGSGFITLQRAAKRGWRDIPSQFIMLNLALRANDFREAARRLIAIWILDEKNPELPSLASQILHRPDGRETFVQIFGSSRQWDRVILRSGPNIMGRALFATILTDALNEGTQFDCELLDGAIGTFNGGAPATLIAAAQKTGCTLG